LSYGLPVLASDIPANLAVGLEPGEYFRLGDVGDLARAMRGCCEQPRNEETRATRRRWIAERYDWHRIAEQTHSLYKTTLLARQ
jgi:glycosyltransferase involved in cell wall biosynthesis